MFEEMSIKKQVTLGELPILYFYIIISSKIQSLNLCGKYNFISLNIDIYGKKSL